MYSEVQKLHIIEEVLKIKSDAVLMELEAMISKANNQKIHSENNARDFLGLISESDIILMDNAIIEGCEQIDPDDWK